MDTRNAAVDKKIHWQCLFVLCGGMLLDAFIWVALDNIDYFLFLIMVFLIIATVLTVNVFTAVAVPDNGTFPREHCTSVSLTFSGIMAVSSFMGRIIISMITGAAFTDPKGFWLPLALIGILMLIIFAVSFVICVCAFHLAFRRALKHHTPTNIRS